MNRGLYALPTDNKVYGATLSATGGTVDPLYGVEFAQDKRPDTTLRFSTPNAGVTVTLPGSEIIQGAAFINTRGFAGKTITFAGQPVAAPIAWANGFEDASWIDLRDAPITASSFVLNVAGSGIDVSIGEIWVVTNLRTWPYITPGADDDQKAFNINHRTEANVSLTYSQQVDMSYILKVSSLVTRDELTAMKQLHASIDGQREPFLFIRNEQVNEAHLMQFTVGTGITSAWRAIDRFVINMSLEKMSYGVAITG
jgi:hypothetical protein